MNESLRESLQNQFQWQVQLPWLLLILLALPLVLSAWKLKIYPSIWWIVLLTISVACCIVTIFAPNFLVVTAAIDVALLLLASADLVLLYVQSNYGIQASRSIARTVSLGVPFDSEVTIENRSGMTLVGEVRDDLPEHFSCTPSEHALRLAPRSQMSAKRKLTPGRRGSFELQHVYLKFNSLCRLWVRHVRIEVQDSLKVYPDMKQLADYALLARTNRLSLIGVRKTRRIGQDSDFERLRDYSRDDNYRHIDWRSTARRRKLTVRQFQSDQSQRIIFLLDCGRMMTNSRDGYSLLDHALNSMLMMAYVALSQGDSVGLLCFSDTIHSYIPPRGGSSQMNRLLQAGFDQFPRLVESRYDQAFLYLSTHCKRRSLVVLATNVIDEVNAGAVADYLGNISGQHLPLGVLLRDRQMFDAADSPGEVGDGDDFAMYKAAAAADILLWRDQVIRDLGHRGVLTVDAFPDELTAPLVNQYLEIKAKHLL
ncbi:DUF58 domain-containing protein [Rubripirellula amarantea]|uniref:DUF58 domain-containing protein n=1 Tax=Rubripirellula amarantea TaxID=2527999 RepID=A0A5C5WQY8_9BACT|nr:DUF58 domain-containing protein [Rubripirellula amarantea]MDA8745319.1 DUF58 domain-containing protein [Rubripirellula amarantea]TWT52569.1 hypothetical protein Pla22_01930 [Rubripirellula amarantea]